MLCLSVFAQDSLAVANSKYKLGLVIGYGDEYAHLVQYSYAVSLIQAQFQKNVYTMHRSEWSVVFLPQFNFSRFKYFNFNTFYDSGFEVGFNVGLIYNFHFIKDKFCSYVLASAGPHYISGAPERQVPGFVFSDNIALGISQLLFPKVRLDLRYGLRHLSNAGLFIPNFGINSGIWSLGLMIDIK